MDGRQPPRVPTASDFLTELAEVIECVDLTRPRRQRRTRLGPTQPRSGNGRAELLIEGGILRPRVEKVVAGGRDQTKLVDGMHKHVAVITGRRRPNITVHVLCFVEADWPPIGGAFTTRGVQVLWPKKLYPQLAAAGPYDAGTTARKLHARLAQGLHQPEGLWPAGFAPDEVATSFWATTGHGVFVASSSAVLHPQVGVLIADTLGRLVGRSSE